jgi:CubicO group peptidase (beta-lactamase class C family)
MTNRIDRAFNDAISDGVFPSAELVVARGGEVIHAASYGSARESTCFDIASLTKPIATATLAMTLDAQGLLKLDDTVYQWLAGARQPAHKRMTVRQLLNHTSGLPAWQPYYRTLPMSIIGTDTGKSMLMDEVKREEPVAEPGEKTEYSDVGYILLGEIIEQAGGSTLDEQFDRKIAKELGLDDIFFVRVSDSGAATTKRRTDTRADQHVPIPRHGKPGERVKRKAGEHRRFAPTEDCPWRERVIHGQVHDQNAYALGGVAGHAGLFSTAADIHRFTLELTNSYKGKSDWIPESTIQEFLKTMKEKPVGEAFALGWNIPSRRNSASGRHFSANSIGHLAYTGCSLWIDLDQDFWVVLLTNRIHPSAMNEKIKTFRPMIHDLIYDEMIGN